jgi:hypothetical protein
VPIKATVQEIRDAFSAFTRMNEEVRLPQKAAWRVARLMGKLKPVVTSFEETQLKLMKDAGGKANDTGFAITAEPRKDGETEAEYRTRMEEHRIVVDTLFEELKALGKEEVEIDYDPIPLSFFADSDKIAEEKRPRFSANDFLKAGSFIKED